MQGIKKTKDNFIWLELNKKQAIELFKTGLVELFILHNDDSESLITNKKELLHAFEKGENIGIEINFLKNNYAKNI
jgi:hypothetical protein